MDKALYFCLISLCLKSFVEFNFPGVKKETANELFKQQSN